MVVPRCHVTRLSVASYPDGRRADAVLTERGPIPVSPDCKVIVALGTIESTRLAPLSFGEDGRIGANLMAHLRSNVDIRVPRDAIAGLSPAVKALQSSALFLKGRHEFTRPDGTKDGTVGHFHFQITASGLGNMDSNSEAELFQKIPDIEFLNQHLQASDSHVVITIRAIGEMQPDNLNSNVTRDFEPGPDRLRRAQGLREPAALGPRTISSGMRWTKPPTTLRTFSRAASISRFSRHAASRSSVLERT